MQCMASVNSTAHHILDLVPTTELPQERNFIGRSRSKRGIFDFVGKISKYLFGTATSGDIEALKRHMQVLNNNNVKLAEVMANQDQHQHCRQKVQQCYGCNTKKSSRCCCSI